MKILVFIAILVALSTITIPTTAFKLPSGHLEAIAYDRVYQEPPYTEAYYCVTLNNERYKLRQLAIDNNDPSATVAGCMPPSYIQTLPLYTFDYNSWRDIAFNHNFNSFDNIANDLVNQRKNVEPFLSSMGEEPFSIVIPPNFDNTEVNKRRFTCGFIFGILRRLQQSPYNLPIQGIYTFYNENFYNNQDTKSSSAPLNNVCDLSGFASSSPLYEQSPYNNDASATKKDWNDQNVNQAMLGGMMWESFKNSSSTSTTTMTIIELDFTSSNGETQNFYISNLYQKAKFNTQQKRKDNDLDGIAVDFVTQTNAAMKTVFEPLTASDLAKNYSCIEKGTCLPIGGQSMFASTRKKEESRLDLFSEERDPSTTSSPAAQLTQTTASSSLWKSKFRFRRSVAVIIPSTSTSSMFHENVPAANGAASGIVAGLSIIDAITSNSSSSAALLKLLTTQVKINYTNSVGTVEEIEWEPTQIHFLFAVGDEYGLIGTGRFITELLTFNCSVPTRYNQTDQYKRICATPLYVNLNFTAVDLSEYTHVFALEQLALGDDVYLHTDEILDRSTSSPSTDDLSTGKGYYGGSFNFSSSETQQRMRTFFSSSHSSSISLSSEPQLPPNGLFAFFETASTKNALLRDSALVIDPVLNNLNPFEKRWNGQFNDTILATISAYDSSYTDPAFQSQGDVANRTEVVNSNPTQLIKKGAQSFVNFMVDLWTNELLDFINQASSDSNVTIVSTDVFNNLPALAGELQASSNNNVSTINSTVVESLWNCLAVQSTTACSALSLPTFKTYYPGVFLGATSQASLPQRIISYFVSEYLSRLDVFEFTSSGGTTTTTTTTTTPAPSSSSSSSSKCDPSCNYTEFCSDAIHQCIPIRVWSVSAFTTLADYTTSSSAPAFLNATPSALKKELLPRVLIDEVNYDIPLWTESFWDNTEMRSGQRQVYNSSGFLMGVAWVVTFAVGGLSFVFMKFGLN